MRATRWTMGMCVLAMSLTACGLPAEPKFVHYDLNKDTPKSDGDMMVVGAAHEILVNHPKVNAGIIGHASSDGTVDQNTRLSMRRAQGVRNLLVQQGISGDRLTTAARGAEQPVATNETEEGRETNRRVEIFFYYPSQGDLQKQYGVHLTFGVASESHETK